MGSGLHNGITWTSNLVGMEAEKDKGLEKFSEQSREGYICQMCRPDPVSLLLHP